MTHRALGDAGHCTAEIAAVVAARLPGADVDRLTGQIAGLKLFPRHVGDLLAHLEAHPGSLASGAAIGPSALRRLLDVPAADHPAVKRMCCDGCGAQTRLPYRKDGASICDSCYRHAHLKFACAAAKRGTPPSARVVGSCARAAHRRRAPTGRNRISDFSCIEMSLRRPLSTPSMNSGAW